MGLIFNLTILVIYVLQLKLFQLTADKVSVGELQLVIELMKIIMSLPTPNTGELVYLKKVTATFFEMAFLITLLSQVPSILSDSVSCRCYSLR